MNKAFESLYADSYDLLYSDKDYAGECDLIERMFQKYGNGSIHCILDMGCGTGNHVFTMVQRGYEVVGVDRSEEMLAHARRKQNAIQNNQRPAFYRGDILNVQLNRKFDAVLIMFAVLSYQLENSQVLSALKNARRHLKTGGLLIFDAWYGPAVLHQRPAHRMREIPTDGGKVIREATGRLDPLHHICTVDYHLRRFEQDRLVEETQESHKMRYFFPLEITQYLESSGFSQLHLGAFPQYEQEPDETTWNILGVARAV
jgi:SAM-dependent methyltransferase